jgi:hypothetical protein
VDRALYEGIAREVLAVEVSAGPGPHEGIPLDVDGGPPVEVWLEKV